MKYPLEQLALIKQKKLEEAERVLTERKEQLEKEQKQLLVVEKERDEVKHHREDKLAQLRQKLDEGSTTDKIQEGKRYLKIVDEKLSQKQVKVTEQQKKVNTASDLLEEARKDLFKKQQAVEKLKIHRKEWEKEMKALEAYQEDLEGDEIGSAMHLLRKRAKNPKHKKG
jgi:hypothetical protein